MPPSMASRFAHLVGGRSAPKAGKSKAEEDEKKDKDAQVAAKAEQDEKDKEAAAKAEDKKRDDETDEEWEARKAKKAGSKKAEGDESDEEMRAESEEDDSDDEMRGKSAAAQARTRENARCAAIFADPAAASNLPLAASLAFGTRMPRAEAIDVLRGAAANAPAEAADARPARRSLAQRHAADEDVPVVQPDAAASRAKPDSPEARAAACFASADKARGLNK